MISLLESWIYFTTAVLAALVIASCYLFNSVIYGAKKCSVIRFRLDKRGDQVLVLDDAAGRNVRLAKHGVHCKKYYLFNGDIFQLFELLLRKTNR